MRIAELRIANPGLDVTRALCHPNSTSTEAKKRMRMRDTAIHHSKHLWLFLFATLLSGLLFQPSTAAASGTPTEREPLCPFPEQLTNAEEGDPVADEAKVERHPGVSFHKRGAHDLYDDHSYTTERHLADRLSGTSRFSQAAEAFSAVERTSTRSDREARRRVDNLERQMREWEPTTGWTLLRDGMASRAILEFGDLAVDEPAAGVPRAGYALARAELGDLKSGVRAMRAAFRTDAQSLHCAPLDDGLRKHIGRLVELYEADDDPTHTDADNHFMRAALHYLIDDLSTAESDVELAIMDGDESESTASLYRMLRRRLFAPL